MKKKKKKYKIFLKKIRSVTKLININCDWTKKHKILQNSKLKLWQNSITGIITKLKKWNCAKNIIETKFDNSNHDITQKQKLWQKYNQDKTQNSKLW